MTQPVPLKHMSVLSVGEILWDIIGPSRHLGGAPFNFAYHCRALGVGHSRILSRVGNDELGALALRGAAELDVSAVLIQTDPIHLTGAVEVEVAQNGDASYLFRPNAAWDFIAFPENARNAADHADILYFGTLAQRSPVSRATLLAALSCVPASCLRVLDLNLRRPFPTAAVVKMSLDLADVLKLNTEELNELRTLFGLPLDDVAAARELMLRHEIPTVVVSDGARGLTAMAADGRVVHSPGIESAVQDTVGSGDACTAALVVSLASGTSLEEAVHTANAAGAYVATQAGATPPMDYSQIRRIPPGEIATVAG